MAQWWQTIGIWYLFGITVVTALLYIVGQSQAHVGIQPAQRFHLLHFAPQLWLQVAPDFVWLILALAVQKQWRNLSRPGPPVDSMLAARFLFTLVQGWPLLCLTFLLLPVLALVKPGISGSASSYELILRSLSLAFHGLPAIVWLVAMATVTQLGMRLAWLFNLTWLGVYVANILMPTLQNDSRKTDALDLHFLYPLDWLLGVSILFALLWALRTKRSLVTTLVSTILLAAIVSSTIVFRWDWYTGSALSTGLRSLCSHLLLGFSTIPVDVSSGQAWWRDHFPKQTTALWYVASLMPLLVQPLTLTLLVPAISWFFARMDRHEEVRMKDDVAEQTVVAVTTT
jgi:hypothetical protein